MFSSIYIYALLSFIFILNAFALNEFILLSPHKSACIYKAFYILLTTYSCMIYVCMISNGTRCQISSIPSTE